jgi:hypothetical protein
MKTLRLYAATLLAIKEHADAGEPFSARDITEYIDGKLVDGEWELVVNNSLKHDTVRAYVHEIMDNHLLELDLGNARYRKTYPVNSEGDSYKQYSVVFDGDIEHQDADFDIGDQDNDCPNPDDWCGNVGDCDFDDFGDCGCSETETYKAEDASVVIVTKNGNTIYVE